MLAELFVRGFGLIEEARIALAPGMTAITGETGAGKSMFVDALQMVFGARASAEAVRRGHERAEIVAVWQGNQPLLAEILAEQDIPLEDELILRRTIRPDGRSRAWVNDVPVTGTVLRRIGEACLEVHGQHAHQRLMRPETARVLLDAKIDPELRQALYNAYRAWQQANEALRELGQAREDAAREAAWLREQLAQIEALGVEPGLHERLSEEVEAGRRHAQLMQAASLAVQAIDEGEPAARSLIAQAARALSDAARFSRKLAEAQELLQQADALLEEAMHASREVLDAPFDENLHAEREDRLERLRALMRRHGVDEEGLLRLRKEWQKKLELAEAGAWDEAKLRERLQKARTHYQALAKKMHAARKAAAEALVHALSPMLDGLALSGMQLRFAITPHAEDESHWRAHGWDEVALLVQPNPGEPWGEVRRIASGGELSRLALAIQACGAQQDAPPLAVFDEADAGVGGETAWSVGRLLRAMAATRQVLVISHLPQVAACAHHQLAIEKQQQGERTRMQLRILDKEGRIEEIARMLGDRNLRAQARALLARGQHD